MAKVFVVMLWSAVLWAFFGLGGLVESLGRLGSASEGWYKAFVPFFQAPAMVPVFAGCIALAAGHCRRPAVVVPLALGIAILLLNLAVVLPWVPGGGC